MIRRLGAKLLDGLLAVQRWFDRRRKPRVSPHALVSAKLPVAARSQALREHFAQHGVELPDLRLVIERADAEVCGFEVHSDDALPTWRRLRAATGRTGYFPLVYRAPNGIDPEDFASWRRTSVQPTLAAAAQIDAAAWFAKQLAEQAEWLEQWQRQPPTRGPEAPAKAVVQEPSLWIAYDQSSLVARPVPGVFVLLLPTRDGCEFPAYLAWGGCNGNSPSEEHVAILRSWRDRFGAEPVAVMWDTLELAVSSPPASADAARRLVLEHGAYCDGCVSDADFAEQVAETLGGSSWFFWWD